MPNAYTFAIVDPSDLVTAAIEADIERCARYVIDLVGRYLDWKGTLDFVVEIKPASQSPYPTIDGILPSVGQVGFTGGVWVNQTLAECLTGFDSDPSRPDAGCTIYLAADGTIKNYGTPVWFDPNPQFEVDPNVPAGRHDFVGIYTHEVFHSLGFWASTQDWRAHISNDGGIDYFVGTHSTALFGRRLPFGSGADHYGHDPAINRGLMYEFGNYERNRWDIGRIDLAVLQDLGHSIRSYEGLSLFELIDTQLDLTGTETADRLYGDYHANILIGLGGDDEIRAGSGNDTLQGGDGNDRLYGDGGNDAMTGGLGDDVYGVDSASDAVNEGAGEGIDEVRTTLSAYTLAANIENLTGTASSGQALSGNNLANVITGGGGDDILTGDGGDTLVGGLGNDIYVLVQPIAAIENAGEGTDEIRTGAAQWVLADNFENLTGTSSEFQALHGNGANNVIRAGSGNADLFGEGGNDTLIGSAAVFEQYFGGTGADLMIGGGGADFYNMVESGDVIVEESGGGSDWVTAVSAAYTLPDHVETLEGRAAFGQALTGSAQANRIIATDYDDVLDGGAGDDTLEGGFGDDVYVIDSLGDTVTDFFGDHDEIRTALATYTLAANIERLTGLGGSGQSLTGNALANLITGGSGNDVLDGGDGADTLAGRLGNDVYLVSAGDAVTENSGEGIDEVRTALSSYALGANLENLVFVGSGGFVGTGNALANSLRGGSGNDTLDGGAGADAMAGGLGNDAYVVDDAGDTLTEAAGAGTDTVESAVSYTLGANLENLVLTGTAADGTGNALANALTGNAAANRLDGRAGADAMAGGLGDDIYVVDHFGDAVTEAAGAGTDRVESSVTHVLGTNVENLVLTGTLAINGTGNALANQLNGNSAANRLDGGAGADLMAGGAGDDIYTVDDTGDQAVELSGQGKDQVRSSVSFTLGAHVENLLLTGTGTVNGSGNALGNSLTGNAAANILDGGAGADSMAGGGGNDTYQVDNVGDRVSENANEGTDTVLSSISFSLTANIETLMLTGAAAINATGNSLANSITGNSAANLINGGGGADAMSGGGGDDIYIVDNIGDAIAEAVGAGTDLVKSSVSFTLFDNVEKLTLRGSAETGFGNGLANTIAGNAAANVLDGRAGADKLIGYDGNDTYFVDNSGDQAIETSSGGGFDTVRSSVTFILGDHIEDLILEGAAALNGTGNGGANVLRGNAGANILDGGRGNDALAGDGGNDTLKGGFGNDTLEGGAGADDFVFDKALAANNVDFVLDFAIGSDRIVLENAVFKGIAAGALAAQALRIGTAAADADDRLVYDPATGRLWYDADGSGAAAQILFATLDNPPATLAASDFSVI